MNFASERKSVVLLKLHLRAWKKKKISLSFTSLFRCLSISLLLFSVNCHCLVTLIRKLQETKFVKQHSDTVFYTELFEEKFAVCCCKRRSSFCVITFLFCFSWLSSRVFNWCITKVYVYHTTKSLSVLNTTNLFQLMFSNKFLIVFFPSSFSPFVLKIFSSLVLRSVFISSSFQLIFNYSKKKQ